jgi:hypothetical protein
MTKHLVAGLTALVLTAAQALPAFAWTQDSDDAYAWGMESDTTGAFALVIDCDLEWGDYAIGIETSEPWQETTSYAPEVPVTFTIDGQAISTDAFRFVNRGGKVTVELYEYGDDTFDTIYEALYKATGEIAVSYFDKSLRFASTDIAGVLDTVEFHCWG